MTADAMIQLRDRLAQPGAFVVAAEIVTSRGVISAEGAGRCCAWRGSWPPTRWCVLSITDNPGRTRDVLSRRARHGLISTGGR